MRVSSRWHSIFTAALVVTAGALASAEARAEPVVGKPAPDFTGTDSNGKTVKLSSLKGKIVVLEWTNHDCPYTVKHYKSGNMQALQKAAAGKGTVWLTVVSSAKGEQGHVTAKEANGLTTSRKAAPTAVVLDPEGTIGKLYAARTTPHMYIIDKAGTLAYMGAIDDKPSSSVDDIKGAKNYVSLALAALEAGKPVPVKSTRPYGCSVKYK
ncbi:MAG: redoxin domain-containing protein [Hyphomicrobiaceae bacterium]